MSNALPFAILMGDEPDKDSAFCCDCDSWILYHSIKELGKVITCDFCETKWKVVLSNPNVESIQRVNDAKQSRKAARRSA